MAIELRPLPPNEAVEYFRSKGFKLGFDWRDTFGVEHSRAFTVAKAMQLDLLADIRQALDKALAEGQTLQQFQKGLQPLLEEKGWWGRKTVVDPATGAAREVQLGSPRRLQVIFQTNLRTARAAGAWERIQRSKAALPYLRYSAVLDSRTRPLHRAWHGTILHADHPWWRTHYPPNGWNCRCTVTQLSERDLRRDGWKLSEPPAEASRRWLNQRTGETVDVPAGIDPGFGHNVGQAAEMFAAERQLVQKLVDRPADLAATAYAETKQVLTPALREDFAVWARDLVRDVGTEGRRVAAIPATGQIRVAGAMEPPVLREIETAIGASLDSAALVARDDVVAQAMAQAGELGAAPAALVEQLPAIVAEPRAVLIDTVERAILYLADVGDGRLAAFVWAPGDGAGKLNQLASTGLVEPEQLRAPRYRLISGSL